MNVKNIRRRQRGQGMTEYIIIVALVAIAAIAVYSFFGKTVRGQMDSITSQLSGQSGTNGIQKAKAAAGQADTEANAQYNLGNYNNNAANAGQK
jgi:Flp pilus assembly pilin Flp